MDFHAFVFWDNGMYTSLITNKPSTKKRTSTDFNF